MPEKFNVRVYGLWMHEGAVLLTDELHAGQPITKFPGGGLQFGEGLHDALIREWKEETGQLIRVGAHFYTTDFFQRSAFREEQQVISVYYRVHPRDAFRKPLVQRPFDFDEKREGAQCFRWQRLNRLHPDQFTFPIEQMVAARLKQTI